MSNAKKTVISGYPSEILPAPAQISRYLIARLAVASREARLLKLAKGWAADVRGGCCQEER
jgi:hypothetical protein